MARVSSIVPCAMIWEPSVLHVILALQAAKSLMEWIGSTAQFPMKNSA